VDSDRIKGNSFKLKEGKFFTERVVNYWTSRPREAVDALSLEVFKTRLDGALESLV